MVPAQRDRKSSAGGDLNDLSELKKQQLEEAGKQKIAEKLSAALQDDVKALESSKNEADVVVSTYEAKQYDNLERAKEDASNDIEKLEVRTQSLGKRRQEVEDMVKERLDKENAWRKSAKDSADSLKIAQDSITAPPTESIRKLTEAQERFNELKKRGASLDSELKAIGIRLKGAFDIEQKGKNAAAWFQAAYARETLVQVVIPSVPDFSKLVNDALDELSKKREVLRSQRIKIVESQVAVEKDAFNTQQADARTAKEHAGKLELIDEGVPPDDKSARGTKAEQAQAAST